MGRITLNKSVGTKTVKKIRGREIVKNSIERIAFLSLRLIWMWLSIW